MPLPTIFLSPDGVGQNVIRLEFDPARISPLSSSLGIGIAIPLEPPIASQYKLLAITGVISFSDEYFGLVIPSQPLTTNRTLDIPITSEALARLERKRGGGELSLQIKISALATYNDSNLTSLAHLNPILFQIPRDNWLRVLQAFDGQQRRIVELPPTPSVDEPHWRVASDAITSSSWRLARGDSGGSMAETRTALERIVEGVGNTIGRPRTSNDKAFKNYVEAVIARLQDIRANSGDPYSVLAESLSLVVKLFAFSSEASHQGLSSASQTDAELALSLATAIYTFSVKRSSS